MSADYETIVKRVEGYLRKHAGKPTASIAHEIVVREKELGTVFGESDAKDGGFTASPDVAKGPPVELQMRLARLTRREWEVLEMITAGNTDKIIAKVLGICPVTVKQHAHSIFVKLGVRNRTQAALVAVGAGK